jgi:hypothetical protein
MAEFLETIFRAFSSWLAPAPRRGSKIIAQGKRAKRAPPWVTMPKILLPLLPRREEREGERRAFQREVFAGAAPFQLQ